MELGGKTMSTTSVPEIAPSTLAQWLDDLLEADSWKDFGPNGLQVEGRNPIRRLATGVSACHALFQQSAEWGADAILVHHGLFWEGAPRQLTGVQYQRVAKLMHEGIALLAYHLPLDAHAELGNNILAATGLGLGQIRPFGRYQGSTIGFQGEFGVPIDLEELRRRCEKVFSQKPFIQGAGPKMIRHLGLISGSAEKELHQAIEAGLDAYLTGESTEWVMNLAREAGIHFIAAGHYATERLGVRRLGELIGEEFGVQTRFIDIPNPV